MDFAQQPPAQELIAKDLHGNEWKFRHIFRGSTAWPFSNSTNLSSEYSSKPGARPVPIGISSASVAAQMLIWEFVNNVWCIKILMRQEVQQMGKPSADFLNTVHGKRLPSNSCDEYITRQDSRSLSSTVTTSVGTLEY
ncbi:hypothetical protein GW17_00044018 [Ensete ventricosum]|nr:hypothetical protein GW17_00044018 [Ensete ventricosum]